MDSTPSWMYALSKAIIAGDTSPNAPYPVFLPYNYPLTSSDWENAYSPSNRNGDLVKNLTFSQLVNLLPRLSMVFSPLPGSLDSIVSCEITPN